MSLALACSGGESPTPTQPPVGTTPQATQPQATQPTATEAPANGTQPKSGGHLRAAINTDIGALDISITSTSSDLYALNLLHAQLIRQVPGEWTTLGPDLAEDWSVSDDNLVWTFKLREDAKWHDGEPVTSEDVVYTVNRWLDPPRAQVGGNTGCWRAFVDRIEADGPHAVNVHLKSPAVSFLQCAGLAYARMQPKHVLEVVDAEAEHRDLRANEVTGAGPFKLKEHRGSVSFEVERHPDYHFPGQPYLDGITYFVIPALETRLAGMETGELDMISPVETALRPAQARDLEQRMGDDVRISQVQQARFVGTTFNLTAGPFQDIRLRKAFHLATDRQAQIEFVHEGFGALATPFCPCWDWIRSEEEYLQMPGYRADKTEDLAEARRLVDEATNGQGIDVTLVTTSSGQYGNLGEMVRQSVEDAGFRPTLQLGETAALRPEWEVQRFHVVVSFPSSAPYQDPDAIIARHFLPTGDRNWGLWEPTPEYLDLFERESVMVDPVERAQLLRRMDDIIHELVVAVGNTDGIGFGPHRSYVRGLEVLPPSNIADYRFDWVWMDK